VLRRKTRDKIGLAEALNKLGLTYCDIGYDLRAMDYFEQSLVICEDNADLYGPVCRFDFYVGRFGASIYMSVCGQAVCLLCGQVWSFDLYVGGFVDCIETEIEMQMRTPLCGQVWSFDLYVGRFVDCIETEIEMQMQIQM